MLLHPVAHSGLAAVNFVHLSSFCALSSPPCAMSPCCAVTWDHPDMASGLKRIAHHLGHSGASEKQSRPEEVLKKKKKVK